MNELRVIDNFVCALHPEVRTAIAAALNEVMPIWLSEEPVDLRRVVRPTGGGSASITIEPYRGVRTWISYHKKAQQSHGLVGLDQNIRQKQPGLLGNVACLNSVMLIQDSLSLLNPCLAFIERRLSSGLNLSDAIESTLKGIEEVLRLQVVDYEVVSPLGGLSLPDSVSELPLGKGSALRKLTNEEFEAFASNDVFSQENHDFSSRRATHAVVTKGKADYKIGPRHGMSADHQEIYDRVAEETKRVIQALHLLKGGRVDVVANYWRISDLPLPCPGSYSTGPLSHNPFCMMSLDDAEIAQLQDRHGRVASIRRDQLKIALDRLVDAEARLSPVDSLLDSAIGLEVLLKPKGTGDLAFRVAMNYAFLSPVADERKKRFEEISEIQKSRNSIVHAGHGLRSGAAAEISRTAELGKACLRDAINRFLHDKDFLSGRELSADFWADRIFLPSLEA